MNETTTEWRDCADPDELAAAVAAGVEVQRNWGYDWQPGTNNETAEQFAGCTKANCRYRVPASWSWSYEPPTTVAGDDLPERRVWTCKIGGRVGRLSGGADAPMRRAVADAFTAETGCPVEFCFSGWGDDLDESELAVVEDREPDPEVIRAALVKRLTTLPGGSPTPKPPADESDPPEVARRTRREVTDDFTEGTRTIREWVNGGGVHGPALCEELDAWLDYWGGWTPDVIPEASAAARTDDAAPREAVDRSTVSEEGMVTGGKDSGSPATDQPIKVRLTVDLTDRTRVHEITEGGFWRYVTDELDPPERLIVRPGPAPSDRYEYPLDRVACVHMDPIGAKR